MRLEVRDMTVAYGDYKVLDGLSFSAESGQWLMVVGPNGAGKSTMLGALSQSIAYEGSAALDGEDLKKMRPRERARLLGVLTQQHPVGYAFTVEETVQLGRYAYGDGEKNPAVAAALDMTGLTELRHRSVLKISGGELQRTYLARAFAQEPKILLLDEPTNHLDLQYQRQSFELVKHWLDQGDRMVISVVHDLSLARAYGSCVLLMNEGKTVAYGKNEDVLCPENLEKVYHMNVYEWMRKMYAPWGEKDELNG